MSHYSRSTLAVCPSTSGVCWQYVHLFLEYAGSMLHFFWSMLAVSSTTSGVFWLYVYVLLLLEYAGIISHFFWSMLAVCPTTCEICLIIKSICEMCTFLPVSHLGVFRYLGNSRLCSVVWYYLPPPHTPGRGVVGKHKNTASKILGHSWAAIFLHFVWMDSVTRIVVNLTLSMGFK